MRDDYVIITDFFAQLTPGAMHNLGIYAIPVVMAGGFGERTLSDGLHSATNLEYPDVDTVVAALSCPLIRGKDVLVLAVGSEFDPAARQTLLAAIRILKTQYPERELLAPDTHASFMSLGIIVREVLRASDDLSLREAARLTTRLTERLRGIYLVTSLDGCSIVVWPWDDGVVLRSKDILGAKTIFAWPVRNGLEMLNMKYAWKGVTQYLLGEMTDDVRRVRIAVSTFEAQVWATNFMEVIRTLFPGISVSLCAVDLVLEQIVGDSAMLCVWL